MTTYEEVREKANNAFREYDAVRQAYRLGKVDDNTFIAARKEYAAVQAEFEAAYAAAQEVQS